MLHIQSERSPNPNKNHCRTRCGVCRVPLIHKQVCRFTPEQKCASIWVCDFERSFPSRV